ncbi:Ku protein [Paracoccus sp. SJTW-4]|uniref:non-homologous end joining protein Ku n=1 Tax=Paracoccus sp. SJTW-4 TaxID=3078428 RepID=UPI0039EABA3D
MAPRANWKGVLKIGEVACPVALYTAASTSDRIAFHTINRATGHRVHREFVDAETGKPVPREDQVKGYALAEGEHIVLDPEEIAAAIPDSDKMLAVEAFLPCGEIDDVYFDKPYYLAPSDRSGQEAFALIRDGMAAAGVAAIARTVLFRRMRTVLIRAHGPGLVATTLNFDYEVRSAEAAFRDIPALEIGGEMLDLARHIIETKIGKFDPAAFDDRYESALEELVRAKIEGREIAPRPAPRREKVVDLMQALRESARLGDKPARGKAKAPSKRKAG